MIVRFVFSAAGMEVRTVWKSIIFLVVTQTGTIQKRMDCMSIFAETGVTGPVDRQYIETGILWLPFTWWGRGLLRKRSEAGKIL